MFECSFPGPMTVPLVSTSSNPPIPLPMQVPPGHVVQQIVDESGTLRHVIVSHQPPLMPIPAYVSYLCVIDESLCLISRICQETRGRLLRICTFLYTSLKLI